MTDGDAHTGRANALDHVGVVGHDLPTLAAQYECLGFTLTPRALAGGGRIQNRCVMLRHGYLELMALSPGGDSATLTRMLARHIGAHIIALAVGDEAASIARLHRAGIECPGPEQSKRLIDESDRSSPHARFLHLPVPVQAEARINLIRHLTPELLWQERFLTHPNHAVALEEVILAVPSPAESAARFSRLAGRYAEPDPAGGYALVLPQGRIRLLPVEACDTAPPAVPSIAGITLRTDDGGAAITRLLAAGALAHDVVNGAVTTPPSLSGGVTLRFT